MTRQKPAEEFWRVFLFVKKVLQNNPLSLDDKPRMGYIKRVIRADARGEKKMSTRATYEFTTQFGTKVTFYIHHDGYPTGAANYFQKMMDLAGDLAPNISLADRFIKANDRAEITGGHSYHADTDYRYTVKADGELTVQERVWNNDLKRDLIQTLWTGHMSAFLEVEGKV